MKAVVFERFGEPRDVLEVRDVPIPEPGPGEVRVRMIASPINPSDLLVVRGRYVKLPEPPAIPGFEGVGIVDKAGSGLLGRMLVGKRVAVINDKGGNWAEYAVVNARQARPVPSVLTDDQVATYFVNPATALGMVRHVLRVPRGHWLLQSAANSSLGRMIIRLGRHDGFRTANVVRRAEDIALLRELGGDLVIATENGPIESQVRDVMGESAIRHAIDPVGGEIGSALVRCLAKGGRMLVYGSLAEEPIQIRSRALITGHLHIEGFWLGHFMRSRYIPENLKLFRSIGDLIRRGILETSVDSRVPIDRFQDAVRISESSHHSGKCLISMEVPEFSKQPPN